MCGVARTGHARGNIATGRTRARVRGAPTRGPPRGRPPRHGLRHGRRRHPVPRALAAHGPAAAPAPGAGARLAPAARGDQFSQHILGQNRADRLDQNPDRPATGQTNGKGILVADAEFQQTRFALIQRLHRLDDHRGLDAPARD